jgi:hypothetical protein
MLVTSNIIQSVALCAGGWLNEGSWLESQTNFFLFNKSSTTEQGLDSRMYGSLLSLWLQYFRTHET